jgi:hypothetical protein
MLVYSRVLPLIRNRVLHIGSRINGQEWRKAEPVMNRTGSSAYKSTRTPVHFIPFSSFSLYVVV